MRVLEYFCGIFNISSCGKGVDPMEMLGKSGTNTGRGFMYVKDTTDATLDWIRSPNCFRLVDINYVIILLIL